MKRLLLGLLLLLGSIGSAFAQAQVRPCYSALVNNIIQCIDVSTTNPLPVNATVSATVTFPTIGAAVPATGVYNALDVGGTLRGVTGLGLGSTFSQTVAIVDASGNQITSFGGSGGTSSSFGAAFPATGTASGMSDGVNMLAMKGDANGQYIQGNVASAVADAGNPVKIGAKYNSTLPTYTDGQRTGIQSGTRGSLSVQLMLPDSASVVGNGANDGTSKTTSQMASALRVSAPGYAWDGSAWQPNQGDATNGLWVNVKSATGVAQGSTTSGQTISPVGCRTLTSAPTDTTAQTNMPSCTTAGAQRVDINSIAGTTAVTGSGNATGALRVEVANNGTGLITANPATAANWAIGATAASIPANAQLMGCTGSNVEQTAVTNGQLTSAPCGLGGKLIVMPYAVKELMARGSGSATDTAATTIIAAGSGSNKTYVTDWECSNTSATTARVTFNDGASTTVIVPAGGGNNKSMHVPLVTAAATAFTFTSSASVSTMYCSAQGYYGL